MASVMMSQMLAVVFLLLYVTTGCPGCISLDQKGRAPAALQESSCSPWKLSSSSHSFFLALNAALKNISVSNEVEGSAFYLAENLMSNFAFAEDYIQELAILESYCCGHDQCLDIKFRIFDGMEDECWNPQASFSSFHWLLSSFVNDSCAMTYTRYAKIKRLAQGAFGETWLASPSNCHTSSSSTSHTLFVLKRIKAEKGARFYLSGLREKHFGRRLISTSNHIARYVESIEPQPGDLWLVSHYEGISLLKLLYTVENAGQLLHPSNFWHWLKETVAGRELMHNIIWQLLMALKSCHDLNITHRDIKPANVVICFEDRETGRCSEAIPEGHKKFRTNLRIIDFGSAIDEFTVKHLYGSIGPSRAEQTFWYSAPETFLDVAWHPGPTSRTLKYDMWCVGVLMLEMILGSQEVFQVRDRSHATIDAWRNGFDRHKKPQHDMLAAWEELCIIIPVRPDKMKKVDVSSAFLKHCSEEAFSREIKTRDPYELGFPNIWALRLARGLLRGHPDDRLSVDDALQHPYFQPTPYINETEFPGSIGKSCMVGSQQFTCKFKNN